MGAKDYLLEDHLDRDSFVRAMRNMAERQTASEMLCSRRTVTFSETENVGDGANFQELSLQSGKLLRQWLLKSLQAVSNT